LRQRITINYNIDPLEQHEVMEYINFRLSVAGCDIPLFTGDAVREVFLFSEGYPRLINISCDHALLTGFVRGVARITGSIVSECAEELRIQSVTQPPPVSPPASWPQPSVPLPMQYAPAAASRDKGLSSAQTMLVVIIGLLCFVVGLMVFSLRERSPGSDVASKPIEGAGSAAEQTTTGAATPQGGNSPVEIPANSRDGNLPKGAPDSSEATPLSDSPAHARSPLMAAAESRLEALLSDTDILMVYFQTNSNELTSEDMQDLDRVAAVLNAREDISADVTGYTDAVGNDQYNLKVSEFRANIVKTYLVGKGVAADRIVAMGLGAANPIDGNDSLEGRRRNRRVEIAFQTEATSPRTD
jgi:general secretion pathway protein A